MDNNLIKTNYNIKNYLFFFLLIFCFIAIPAFIISFSIYRYLQTDEEQIIYNLKTAMQRTISELRRNIICEKYLCRQFHEFNLIENKKINSKIEDCINFCKKYEKQYGDKIDFIIFDNKAKIIYNSNIYKLEVSDNDWKKAFRFVKNANSFFLSKTSYNKELKFEVLKKIFGPNIIKDYIHTQYDKTYYNLIWGDSSGKKWPGGFYNFNWGGLFVFVSKELLKEFKHIKYNIVENTKENNIITGLYEINNKKSFWTNKSLSKENEIKDLLFSSKNENKFLETDNYYVCNQLLINNNYVFTIAPKNNNLSNLFFKSLLALLLYLLISIPFIKYLWNTVVLKISGEASIKIKITFLFIFATGIPLLLFTVISREYLLHKKLTLIKQSQKWTTEKILDIEQRYLAFLKDLSSSLDSKIEKWSIEIKDKKLTNQHARKLYNELSSYGNFDYFIIGSNTQEIVARDGFFKYKGELDSIKFDLDSSVLNVPPKEKLEDFKRYIKMRLKDYEVMNIMSKKLCSDLNGEKIPDFIMSKLEIVAESLIQKTFPEIIYSMVVTIGDVKKWGFGNKNMMAYFKLLSLYDKKITDYVLVISWRLIELETIFINEITNKINKNPYGFKFIAFERYFKEYTPKINYDKSELERFANRAEEKPTEELEIISLNGKSYIAVSILSRNLSRFNLIGLYPMTNIDRELNNQNSFIWLLGLFTSILSLSLAHLLIKSFVYPLSKLQNGALAIEKRDFKHRIPKLGVDEFGEVGNIFNHVMVGLEELGLARIVQESMFPKPDFIQGNFSIYGKSVTMIDVGGDYLDFFKVDDDSFSLLIGDVAGHGVGASVIMAMAKSVILGCKAELKSPATVLNSIHKVILAAKNSKQRKIMTFQYMHINSKTGENLFANAGGCSPWLIRHSENYIEEIKKPGPTLGAFKKAVYHDSALDFRPGDAIVFYTDGIIECKDKKGEMLGYDRLKEILLKCWDNNPKKYYENIYNSYLEYIGKSSKAEDDLTIIVLIYN